MMDGVYPSPGGPASVRPSVGPLPTQVLAGLRYYDAGSGGTQSDTMYLLIHGLGGSLDFWTAVAPDLASVARTVAIDMPWFGQSPGLAVHFSLEAVAMRV